MGGHYCWPSPFVEWGGAGFPAASARGQTPPTLPLVSALVTRSGASRGGAGLEESGRGRTGSSSKKRCRRFATAVGGSLPQQPPPATEPPRRRLQIAGTVSWESGVRVKGRCVLLHTHATSLPASHPHCPAHQKPPPPSPRRSCIEEAADKLGFVVRELGVTMGK